MYRIKFLRLNSNKSQREVSAETGIDASYICTAEKYGRMYPRHRDKLAAYFGVDSSTLLDEVREVEAVR
ncbi:MAG: helix-turn-helix transcriptional regulator [Coriobacteriales bacterium]|nr:helix-turn-helix transcriptional regulator [Coriobacteriales bacterium]